MRKTPMHKTIFSIMLTSALLASCSEPAEPDTGSEGSQGRAEDSATVDTLPETDPKPIDDAQKELPAPPSLIGEYRVAGIDGKVLDADIGIALSIGRDRIDFENCQLVRWSYMYDAGELTTARVPSDPISGDLPTPPPCAAPFPPPVAKMVVAIDEAERAGRTPTNGIILSGSGHSVTLFTQ